MEQMDSVVNECTVKAKRGLCTGQPYSTLRRAVSSHFERIVVIVH